MWMVGIISVFMVWPMMTLSQFEGLASYSSYGANRYTLGNIGGAESVCAQARIDNQNSLILDCGPGTYIDLEAKAANNGDPIFDLGLIPYGSQISTFCSYHNAADEDICGSTMLDKLKFYQDAMDQCHGQTHCVIEDVL